MALLLLPSFPLRADELPGRDSNFVFISAIKSISGREIDDELLDVNFRFNIVDRIYSLAGIDLAFATVKTDSQRTEQRLSEANVSVDAILLRSSDGLRSISIGALAKVFNGVAYVGAHVGSLESHPKGPLYTSYVFLAFLTRAQSIDHESNKLREVKASYQNVYIEFALHSQHIDLLKFLRFKGGLLLPLAGGKLNGIESRIVLEVPIGGITNF